ncbi:13256_t:CDS:2, partial [Gigaspora margarita]
YQEYSNNAKELNLACLVLAKAEKLELYFDLPSELWQIEQGGVPLNQVLEKSFNQKTVNTLKQMNLFSTAQLISAKGTELIMWSQLKLCRNCSQKERKPNWFVVLEKVLLKKESSRKIASRFTIDRENSMNEFSYFIKVGNFSIVSKIRELVSLKEVNLELVKVRGHSDDFWNTRADILAKKGILAGKKQ